MQFNENFLFYDYSILRLTGYKYVRLTTVYQYTEGLRKIRRHPDIGTV